MSDPSLDPSLWEPITATGAAKGFAKTDAESDAYDQLGEIFAKMEDRRLHIYLHDKQPIGPRIGITDVPESTISACAFSEQLDRRSKRELKSARRTEFLGWAMFAIAALTLIAHWVGWIGQSWVG